VPVRVRFRPRSGLPGVGKPAFTNARGRAKTSGMLILGLETLFLARHRAAKTSFHFSFYVSTSTPNRLVIMRKSVLFLGLLGFAGSAQAQRWTVVNTTTVATFGNYVLSDINTVSANVAWGLSEERQPAGTRQRSLTYVRTNNPAGTEFDFSAVTGSTANFEAANIDGITDQIAVAAMFDNAGKGEIVRTINGGTTWSKVSGNAFALPDGFNNWVHMFDANQGVSLGDPNGGGFEVLRTANGGTSWTRVLVGTLPASLPLEYGLVRSYHALPPGPGFGTIYAGTNNQSVAPASNAVRILKSTDFGATWIAQNTPLTESISRIAFKNANEGIAYNRLDSNPTGSVGTINVMRTLNGGTTWSLITPVSNAAGKFYAYDIDVVPATANTPAFYVSAGFSSPPGTPQANITNDMFGSSVSLDGITWKDIENASTVPGRTFTCLDVLSPTAGYAGGFNIATGPNAGAEGIYKVASNFSLYTPLPARTATERVALGAYPNPSTGLFKVQIESGVQVPTQLTVTDALGRQVYRRQLLPNAAGAEGVTVDLTKEKAGVYVMELRSATGVSQKKIVVE